MTEENETEDMPDWLPEEYDPDAPLRERLPIMADIEGGIELHVKDERGTVDILGRPKELNTTTWESGETLSLQAGGGAEDHVWNYEIAVPAEGEPHVKRVDPMQSHEAYLATKRTYMTGIDIRIYGVDADRFEEQEAAAGA